MSEKTVQTVEVSPTRKPERKSRFLPLATAALICFAVSVVLGSGAWYLFGSRRNSQVEQYAAVTQETEASPALENQSVPAENVALHLTTEATVQTELNQIETIQQANQTEDNLPEIEGVVRVEGGEVALGGDGKRPWQRLIINNFAIAETEVTNAQYYEFVVETNYAAPSGWKNGKFLDGAGNYPVTNVSWRDADAFCRWLAKKFETEVRLPTEAEWELAAAGGEGKKFPWGDQWNKEAAISLESGGKVSAVKRFALNRSPAGAFDMVGNVWEWTQDKVTAQNDATDKQVEQALKSRRVLRVVKGGAAEEPAEQISAQARFEIPETTRVPTVGFRYVVIRRQ